MKRTIREAIIQVLKSNNQPMAPEDIYLQIENEKLYHFSTDQPVHVVRTRLRRDCEGLDFKTASQEKHFQLLSNGTYWLKGMNIPKGFKSKAASTHPELNDKLSKNYDAYITNFKEGILRALKNLSPSEFEGFCKNLISVYGFSQTIITPPTRDGGIDGFGNLTIGFTDLKVAFECKRWNKNKVDYKIIRSFRGSIPESCIYGILFTTSLYSESAKKEAEREGYKPIVLLDGEDIVDFMIERQFGVGLDRELPVFVNQIDLILSEE
ncbi:restriction endonuclease [Roseivirga pacifica]|jgi:restriction system protein